jgi:hypothetical protein
MHPARPRRSCADTPPRALWCAQVPSEEVIREIRDRYLDYNWHASSYTWKVLLPKDGDHAFTVLDLDKTLEENGRKPFFNPSRCRLPISVSSCVRSGRVVTCSHRACPFDSARQTRELSSGLWLHAGGTTAANIQNGFQ